jgi:hypothetical protein
MAAAHELPFEAWRQTLVVIVIAIGLVAIVPAIMTIVIAVIIVAMFRLQSSEGQQRACHSKEQFLPHLVSH